jgi:hypothetical protein
VNQVAANMLRHELFTQPASQLETHHSLSKSELSSTRTQQPYVRPRGPHSVEVVIFSRKYHVLTKPSKRPPITQLKGTPSSLLKVRRPRSSIILVLTLNFFSASGQQPTVLETRRFSVRLCEEKLHFHVMQSGLFA